MQKQLEKLRELLQAADNNIEISKCFYESNNNKTAKKYELIESWIHDIFHHTTAIQDCIDIKIKTEAFMDRLNLNYFEKQHKYCWQSHMCHFHMALRDWINCPMTCLAEIDEFCEKLLKGD